MAFDYIQVPPNSTGQKIDSVSYVRGANTVLQQIFNLASSVTPTYSAAVFGHATAATPTDFLTILGSSTKTVRVQKIWIAARATAATFYEVAVLKYGAVYTGGTGAAVTAVPHDSADDAATAVVKTWAGGLPTVGTTLVGAIANDFVPMQKLAMTATQPFTNPPHVYYDFTSGGKGIVLRGVTEYLSLNAQGVAVPSGGIFDLKIQWTEE